MDLEQAWEWINREFPFEGYIVDRRESSYKFLVRTALRHIPAGARVLDFGAGPADKTAMFSLVGFDVVAYDDFLDPWHRLDDNVDRIVEFSAKAGVDYRVGPDPFELLGQERFDAIMLHHVLEHLHDSPRPLLLKLLGRLKPGGILFVSVPNAVNLRKRVAVLAGRTNYPAFSSYYWYPGPFRGHIREYVKTDLTQLAEFLGLERVELRSYFHFPHAAPAWVIGTLDALAVVAPGWRDSWAMVARRPAIWEPRSSLRGPELAQSLGRSEYFDYSSVDDELEQDQA